MVKTNMITVIEKNTGKKGEFDETVLHSHCLLQKYEENEINTREYYLREDIDFSDFKKFYNLLWNLPNKNLEPAIFLGYIFSNYRKKYDLILELLPILYNLYGKTITPKLYPDFANLEQSLYVFERGRYRDHFLHMFNVYLMGEIILRKVERYILDKGLNFSTIFKISEEHAEMAEVRNGTKVTPRTRLFPIWFYMSTFHDMGYPVECNQFIEKTSEIFRKRFFLDVQLSVDKNSYPLSISDKKDTYLAQIVSLFDCKLEIKEDGDYNYNLRKSDFSSKSEHLISQIRTKSYGGKIDHGVVSAILLLHYISEDAKERFGSRSGEYIEHFVNHDLTRAALGICIHNIDPDDIPIFPVQFDEFPLIFLLILCDEIEEWERPEYCGDFLSTVFPVDWYISFEESERLLIKITVDFSKLDNNQDIGKFIRFKLGNKSFKEYIDYLKEKIEKKISIGSSDWIEFLINFELPNIEVIEKYLETSFSEIQRNIESNIVEHEEKTQEEYAKEIAPKILGTNKKEIGFKIGRFNSENR